MNDEIDLPRIYAEMAMTDARMFLLNVGMVQSGKWTREQYSSVLLNWQRSVFQLTREEPNYLVMVSACIFMLWWDKEARR